LLNHLIDAFSRLDDPRCTSKVEHNLLEILIMAICGVIAGAESWEDIALYAQSKTFYAQEVEKN
jgi:hypothetical protein